LASYRCSVKDNVTRSKGQSLVNSAAYVAREKLYDERLGKIFDYSRHSNKALLAKVYAPDRAPKWAKDIGPLCNAIEHREDKTTRPHNAQLARPLELNLPHELTLEEIRLLLDEYIHENFTQKGYAVIAALHEPRRRGDERNIHAHLLLTLRTIDENGFAKNKERTYQRRSEYTQALKESWARLGAKYLERAGQTIEAERWRHGHKTLAEQRVAALARGDLEFAERSDRDAGKHLGPKAAAMERRGLRTDRGDKNRAIEERNAKREKLKAQLKAIDLEIAEIEREKRRLAEHTSLERKLERVPEKAHESEQKSAPEPSFSERPKGLWRKPNGRKYGLKLQPGQTTSQSEREQENASELSISKKSKGRWQTPKDREDSLKLQSGHTTGQNEPEPEQKIAPESLSSKRSKGRWKTPNGKERDLGLEMD
jgi:hypothetical protein